MTNTPEPRLHQIRLDPTLPVQPLLQNWKKLINLGYASTLRGYEMEAALSRLQQDIGFQYGRICRITDLIETYEIDGQPFFDYSAVYALLDQLEERRMIPFLELGNKSFLIQESTTLSHAPISASDTREYFSHLIRILPEFLRSCINHYGQESIDRWYFEISFMYTDVKEREVFGFTQFAGVFRRIYDIIRSFSAKCRIGGPGFNDWSDPARIGSAYKTLMAYGKEPDFFSFYLYPLEISDRPGAILSTNPELASRRMEQVAEIIRSLKSSAELWVTECNSNLSCRNLLNDSCYQAVFLAKLALAAQRCAVTAIGYYLLSDAPLHYYDSLDFLFGGWGLLSDQNIPKPSYYAYELLNRLGTYLIESGDSFLVSSNSGGSFQLLAFRYCHPKEPYCLSNIDKYSLESFENVFDNSGSDQYHFSLRQVQKGTYILRRYQIDLIHANIFRVWRQMNYLRPNNELLLSEIESASSLIPEISVYRVGEDRVLSLSMELPMLSVSLITVDLYDSRTDTGDDAL